MFFINTPNFTDMRQRLRSMMLNPSVAHLVETTTWQGIDVTDKPQGDTIEILNLVMTTTLSSRRVYGPKAARLKSHDPESLDHWREDICPNLPWADDHFEERVGGHPLNPGKEWKNWPYSGSANRFRNKDELFNHSYAERLWPKYARQTPGGILPDPIGSYMQPIDGIAHSYGDLGDVIALLIKDPTTRQAWIPLFFPEDTGIGDGGRKPCTLGYQIIVRENHAHIFYPMRSCDFVRHWQDDMYLAVRLLLWVIDRCREGSDLWKGIVPGSFNMHVTSMHMFTTDLTTISKRS